MTTTLELMDAFLDAPDGDVVAELRDTSAQSMRELLGPLSLPSSVVDELVGHWDELRGEEFWSTLLGRLVAHVRARVGDRDAPIAIWPDLEAHGPSGRLLYYYLCAFCVGALIDYLRGLGAPDDLIDATVGAVARHGETHALKWATTGIDAGWWMIPILCGELVQVGTLKFHRIRLGQGVLAPDPWYTATEYEERGEGFRPGDESLGIHIPARIDLSPETTDRTLARAREVLGALWPTPTQRLATCQSWMMDERLEALLGPASRVVQFQRRFTVLDRWFDDVDIVRDFLFLQPEASLDELVATSRLQRAVLEELRRGGQWHWQSGWFLFDGPGVSI